jgi:CheY-like chemotaxis protein
MQNLIKRTTGPNAAQHDGKTLAERLAQSRQSPAKDLSPMDAGEAFDDGEEDEYYEDAEALAPTPLPAPAPHAPAPLVAAEPAQPVFETDETDAIVAAAKAARQGGQQASGTGKTCLIVDDSRVIRKVASNIVTALGYKVAEAENGAEALARCKQSMPHLILTDWSMPEMSGLEFVTALRALPTERAPTEVFCTSKNGAQDIHAGIAAGADDYIVKPFDEAAVRAKLAKLGVA